jgi:hypothetical protein
MLQKLDVEMRDHLLWRRAMKFVKEKVYVSKEVHVILYVFVRPIPPSDFE